MSHYDRTMTHLVCKGCGESQPMMTRQIFNPERYVIAAERFSQEHKDCEKFKNQAKAKAALMWRRLCSLMDAPVVVPHSRSIYRRVDRSLWSRRARA